MAQSGYTTIQSYYSNVAGHVPTSANLVSGELAVNIVDGILYYKDNTGAVQALSGGGATGGGGDKVFVQNQTVVTTNYTLTTGFNAESVGPITINGGVTVTVPSGQRWLVL